MSDILTSAFLISVLVGAVRAGTPLLFATLGEILTQRAGVLNLGVEGMMIVGALAGFMGSYYLHSPWIGVLTAMLCAGLISLVHAFLCITLKSDQVVSGITLVLLGVGLTSFIGEAMVGKTGYGFEPLHFPILSDIPFLGQVLFQYNILVYLSVLIVLLLWFFLFRTRLGLEILAVGENPATADTLGIPVDRIRYICVFIGGMLSGLGGCFLSLAYTRIWVDQMTAGRGWIAIALVIFAAWTPQRALIGAYLFGGIEGLQLRLQTAGVGVSYHLMQMMPYLATILVLLFSAREKFRRKIGAPEALMKPYMRGARE
ncbi:ribose ABC transporter, permease protein, RbsC-2 [Candidatus Vecturithrix granuli]|uniref:Ribose ABC transporter, permease protein, RbsC-2 n=1 Tax=Vecturithrix granuli TaxID=1499967 RepID=A0A081C4I3_VECG1|nr:ribose ABC transporter, permease protein, RbsC-2 [Candidatus Vecturithrix granuli]